MVQYLLRTFHSHDEEIEGIHLPIGFVGIMEALAVSKPVVYLAYG